MKAMKMNCEIRKNRERENFCTFYLGWLGCLKQVAGWPGQSVQPRLARQKICTAKGAAKARLY